VSAGERLAALAANAVPPLLAEGFDHQNVECCPDYVPRLKEFLSTVSSSRGPSARATQGGQAPSREGPWSSPTCEYAEGLMM
jgi:hypothetical protein